MAERAGTRGGDGPAGAAAALLRAASEDVLDRARALADVVRSTTGSAVGAVGSSPAAVGDLLQSLQGLVAHAPTPAVPLQLLAEEVRAKRALIQAMALQLSSFDSQLEVLESTLQPLVEWADQWDKVQTSIIDATRLVTGPRRRPTDGTAEQGSS